MSTEQPEQPTRPDTPAEQPQVWGAPQTTDGTPDGRPRWSGRKTAAAVAIAVGIAAAGGAAVYAATNSDTGNQRGGPGMGGPGGMGGGPGGMRMRGLDGALHGEFVVSDGNGGYLTELTQTGKITAITATSLTAASADGFSQTYTIDASTEVRTGGGRGAATGTVSDLTTGETVAVLAKKSGSTATATELLEGGMPAMGPGGAGPGGGQQPGMVPRRDDQNPGGGAPPTT